MTTTKSKRRPRKQKQLCRKLIWIQKPASGIASSWKKRRKKIEKYSNTTKLSSVSKKVQVGIIRSEKKKDKWNDTNYTGARITNRKCEPRTKENNFIENAESAKCKSLYLAKYIFIRLLFFVYLFFPFDWVQHIKKNNWHTSTVRRICPTIKQNKVIKLCIVIISICGVSDRKKWEKSRAQKSHRHNLNNVKKNSNGRKMSTDKCWWKKLNWKDDKQWKKKPLRISTKSVSACCVCL